MAAAVANQRRNVTAATYLYGESPWHGACIERLEKTGSAKDMKPMGSKLLPMTLAELCVHALLLEEGLGTRYGEYARLTRDMGAHDVADAFKEMERLEQQESKALKAGVQGRKLPELSPWEYVWRLTYAPDALESLPRVRPHDVREALQLALVAENRAESFYSDTATHARDAMVRSCAAELAEIKGHRLRQLEHLMARHKRREWFGLRPDERRQASAARSKP